MSSATSSAQPTQLNRYADVAGRIDHELAAEAGSLGACLRHLEVTCREPGYAVNFSYLADALRAYAHAVEPVDRWVQAVGRGFNQADQRSIFFILRQWVRGLVTTNFGSRSEVARISDRYAGLVVQARGTGQLDLQAEAIVRSLRPSLPITRPPVFSLWLAFQTTNGAMIPVIWPIRYLILRFHWQRFWSALPWLHTSLVEPQPSGQSSTSTPLGELLAPLPAPAQSPTSTPLGELLAASSAPATARPGGIRPQERSGAADWTPEEAKKFILEHDYEFSGTLECAVWAQKRAEKITGIKPPSITEYNPDQGAYNYIDIYADSVIPVTRQNAQSTLNRIEPGALLVFDRNEGGAFGSGHVAIIEKVQANGVWISHSNWPKGNPPKIEFYDTEILIGLYVIPAGAEPSPEAAIDESRRKRRQRV